MASRSMARALVVVTALALPASALSGCGADKKKKAEEELAAKGFEGVTMTPVEGADNAWTFEAAKGKLRCKGRVSVVGRAATAQIDDERCVDPEAEKARREAEANDPINKATKACEGGDLDKCHELGTLLIESSPDRRDPEKAREVQKKACDGGIMAACAALGELHARGLGGERDEEAAIALLTKACDAGELRGCAHLGRIMHVNRKNEEARPLFRKACDGNDLVGCNGLATLLREGKGGKKDDKEARRLFSLACDGGVMEGCSNLGVMYATGEGGAKSEARARELLDKACKADVGAACAQLKRLGL